MREAKLLLRDYEETSKIPMDEYVEYQKLIKAEDDNFALWEHENNTLGNQARNILTDMLKQQGHDGVIIKQDAGSFGRATETYIAFENTQIKSATDNVGTFDRSNPDIRFLLADFTPEERNDFILMLKPFVGFNIDHEDEIYQQYMAERGVKLSLGDAHAFAVLAMNQNKEDARKRNAEKTAKARAEARKRRDEWIYANIPLYREAVDFAGSIDFKIKPSARFRGEEFSGSFIAKEFVNYSKSKKKDSSKLDAADGMNSNEFAEALARKWGRDSIELEQEIIDFFRDLKKSDLIREYSEYKEDLVLQ